VANAGWARWAPVNFAAIAAHLVGGAGVLDANKGPVATQRGVGASTIAKLALTGAALGVTAYSGAQGKKLQDAGSVRKSHRPTHVTRHRVGEGPAG
jgi:hypothetical protein